MKKRYIYVDTEIYNDFKKARKDFEDIFGKSQNSVYYDLAMKEIIQNIKEAVKNYYI